MKEYSSTLLAVSRAGHDKDAMYVVIDSDDTYFWLVDGRRRTLDNPKKKKQMHVQIIKHLPRELLAQMQSMTLDAHVRKVLKSYNGSEN